VTRPARSLTLTIAAGRIGLGIGAIAATRPALRALGFERTDATAESLAKLVGGRDIALGLLALGARDDAAALRRATLVGAGADAADALVFALAGRNPELRRAGVSGALSGASAALAGLWAYRGLSC